MNCQWANKNIIIVGLSVLEISVLKTSNLVELDVNGVLVAAAMLFAVHVEITRWLTMLCALWTYVMELVLVDDIITRDDVWEATPTVVPARAVRYDLPRLRSEHCGHRTGQGLVAAQIDMGWYCFKKNCTLLGYDKLSNITTPPIN